MTSISACAASTGKRASWALTCEKIYAMTIHRREDGNRTKKRQGQKAALLMALLAAWSIEQSFSRSVRYFPTAVHAAGALVLVLESSILLNGVDLSSHAPAGTMARFLAGSLPAYLLAAALAAWFWWIIRAAQKQV